MSNFLKLKKGNMSFLEFVILIISIAFSSILSFALLKVLGQEGEDANAWATTAIFIVPILFISFVVASLFEISHKCRDILLEQQELNRKIKG